MTESETREERALARAVARLRAGVMAAVFGMTAGTGLWLATVWLVVRGGENVGQHLSLLRFYFPGYSVTWGGAFVGFVYGALVGAVAGFLLAWIYNRLADRRHGLRRGVRRGALRPGPTPSPPDPGRARIARHVPQPDARAGRTADGDGRPST